MSLILRRFCYASSRCRSVYCFDAAAAAACALLSLSIERRRCAIKVSMPRWLTTAPRRYGAPTRYAAADIPPCRSWFVFAAAAATARSVAAVFRRRQQKPSAFYAVASASMLRFFRARLDIFVVFAATAPLAPRRPRRRRHHVAASASRFACPSIFSLPPFSTTISEEPLFSLFCFRSST